LTFRVVLGKIKQRQIQRRKTVKKILCFGDSNTWGHDPVDCSRLERRWTVMIDEMFDDCEIVQDGVCGRATKLRINDEWGTDGLSVFRKNYLKNNGFDLVIIMLGTNDLLNENDFTVEETGEHLRTMVKEMRESLGDDAPEVLLISPILISKDMLTHPVFSTLYSEKSITNSKRFAEIIEKVATEENAHFLDAAKVSKASPLDGIHMESSEHKELADAIAEKIKSILF